MKKEYERYFPYQKYRDGQLDLIREITTIINNGENIIIRAPSGFGKTITVLTATLPILERDKDKRLIWLCRTHRENNRIIEELKRISGIPNNINALPIEARTKLCIKPFDQELKRDHEAFSILCSEIRKQNKCEYYNRNGIAKVEIPQICSTQELIEICREEGICPYEVAKINIEKCRILIANYNYIIMPQILKNLRIPLKNSILVVDETHNLPDVAINLQTEKITIRGLKETLREMDEEGMVNEKNVVDKLIELIGGSRGETVINKNEMKRKIEDVGTSLEEISLKLIREGNNRRRRLARGGRNPISHIHHLGKFLNHFQKTILREEYSVFTNNEELWIECFDPSESLRKIYGIFDATISMSGTIDEKYGELIGLQEYKYREVRYIDKGRILSILVENVTTDYEERSLEMYRKINEYIFTVAENTKSGVGIFTASYEVLDGLISAGVNNIRRPIFIENRKDDYKTMEWKIESYKKMAKNGGAIYIGVCGGRASEGEDFPGKEMDIVLLVGIPFPEPSLRVYQKNIYYEKRFGENGRLYGYVLPSIWKASQAAGRIMRGPEDKGAIIYLDKRYRRYIDLLPNWIRPSKTIREPAELREELIFFFTPEED
ncbi:MAG: helicase C-terminal domain-containing protein [Candidatus Methanomethylicia archaeon]